MKNESLSGHFLRRRDLRELAYSPKKNLLIAGI